MRWRIVLVIAGLTFGLGGISILSRTNENCATVVVNAGVITGYTCYPRSESAAAKSAATGGAQVMSRSAAGWLGLAIGTLALTLGTLPWSLYPVLVPSALLLRRLRRKPMAPVKHEEHRPPTTQKPGPVSWEDGMTPAQRAERAQRLREIGQREAGSF
jgi:hypothetical protein